MGTEEIEKRLVLRGRLIAYLEMQVELTQKITEIKAQLGEEK
jgi:hypothetical protein